MTTWPSAAADRVRRGRFPLTSRGTLGGPSRRASPFDGTGERRTMSDPRVFFAAERTLLAWIRTGLTIMGFGFVVARFGLFLRVIAAQRFDVGTRLPANTHISNYVGLALILLGIISMSVAALQHRSFVSSLPAEDIPRSHNPRFPVLVALSLSVLGVVLAAYLVA
jgi:putative membrane protein